MNKRICILFMLMMSVFRLNAQMVPELTFRNQPINVILLTLAEQADVQIIYDSTVTGNASFYFTPMKLEKALTLLLDTINFYYWERNGVYYVSKIRVIYNEENKLCSVDSEDVDILQVINRISAETKTTILKDPLPRDTSSLHIKDMPLQKILEIISTKLSDYELQVFDDYFYIKKTAARNTAAAATEKAKHLFAKSSNGLYSVKIENNRFKELLDSLFNAAGIEYSFLGRNDSVIPRMDFENKSFDEMLSLLLEQGDADFTVAKDIYYIFDLDRRETVKKYNSIVPVSLQWLKVENLPALFPAGLANSNNYRLDKDTNTILLYGTPAQIKPIEDFIRMVDVEGPPKDYMRMELKKIKSAELKNILPVELKSVNFIAIPNSNAVIFDVQPQKRKLLLDFLAAADEVIANEPISLKYINADTLLEKLPPSVAKENIVTTANPALIFFKGSEEAREIFLKELATVDNPVPQIRYDIMVIEYNLDNTNNWNAGGSNVHYNRSDLDPATNKAVSAVGTFDDLLSLNFDVITNFGLSFAQSLSYELSGKNAKVLTNTRLVGLSGETMKFQNTSTTRFRLYEYDADTGDPIPGSTKEVTSGLIVELTSWASGENEITMDVKTTYSKQSDAEGDNLPTTTEKVITSHARTQSGIPLTISGLFETELTESKSYVPVLGKIPLLGLLFQKKLVTEINKEMVLYILPVLEDGVKVDPDSKMQEYYSKYFFDGVQNLE